MTTVASSLFHRLWWAYALFAALLAGLVALVGTLIAVYGTITASPWNAGVASTAKWLIGSIGLMLTPVYLRHYVANGVTRREFVRGGLLFGIGTAACFAALALAGFGVERLVLGATGLMDGLTEPYPVYSAGTAVAVLVRAFLIYLATFCSGWLLGACFYRYGAYLGMILIPACVIPGFGAELLFGTEWGPVDTVTVVGGPRLPFAVPALITAALVAAGFAVIHVSVRAVAIRGKIV
ncbi:hypothetical protein [Catenuloplanes atrovinosus]|uniref:Uncharacterized protein n=1 Tax=Catenuloplanes atrovinosus TaxID=137266 RepID=A0AAE3YHZ1_9ACTN|nr:hypothetical protein [Catenuloplanes atrovinosus]MDR7273277.1 hypothetical protein [Catenuloplanes atrovinosus]